MHVIRFIAVSSFIFCSICSKHFQVAWSETHTSSFKILPFFTILQHYEEDQTPSIILHSFLVSKFGP